MTVLAMCKVFYILASLANTIFGALDCIADLD